MKTLIIYFSVCLILLLMFIAGVKFNQVDSKLITERGGGGTSRTITHKGGYTIETFTTTTGGGRGGGGFYNPDGTTVTAGEIAVWNASAQYKDLKRRGLAE